MSARYPDPPWKMFGRALFVPCLVRAADVVLPEGLEPIEKFGRTMGILAYIEYTPPSPLTYHELIWMPAWVRCEDDRAGEGGRRLAQFVSRIYVDDESSLEAGRVIWRLPKTTARFEDEGRSVRVFADDGTRIALSWSAAGPVVPLKSRLSTLQAPAGEIVRFRTSFRAEARAATYRIDELSSEHAAWRSFSTATPMPRLAMAFASFEAIMKEPEVLFSEGSRGGG